MLDGYLQEPLYSPLEVSPNEIVLTFNNLIKQTDLIKIMGDILLKLEKAWKHPVDIEFTAHIEKERTIRINLLQCRPLRIPDASDSLIKLPGILARENLLFESDRTLSGGIIDGIKYILYIDPYKYAEIPTSLKRSLGRAVGQINETLRDSKQKFMAVGPGRWGSTNIDVGVNVSYADIDNVKVLVEIGLEKAGHEPELSFGTHFFQDLIEAEIIYLPVFPDRPSNRFNKQFFTESKNSLGDLIPALIDFDDYMRLIDVPLVCSGAFAHVVADPQTRKSIGYIE
jgi:hypothetical protein